MKFSALPRIYFSPNLNITGNHILENEHFHYIIKVLRLNTGDQFRVFNEISGEFLAEIHHIQKKSLIFSLKSQLRAAPLICGNTLTLALSIIKSAKMSDAINMATQLGIDQITPIIAARSQSKAINIEKFNKVITEASEQSERLTIPILNTPINLKNLTSFQGIIIYANENEDHINAYDLAQRLKDNILLLIGPEGGFNDEELKFLSILPNAYSITLGTNVLRSEVAVCAGLAQIQLVKNRPPSIT